MNKDKPPKTKNDYRFFCKHVLQEGRGHNVKEPTFVKDIIEPTFTFLRKIRTYYKEIDAAHRNIK